MKLYTEEEIMNYLINHRSTITRYDLQNIPHIQLPSDEEIEEYVDSAGYWGGWSPQYFEGIIEGAKWMRDKIGGNNE